MSLIPKRETRRKLERPKSERSKQASFPARLKRTRMDGNETTKEELGLGLLDVARERDKRLIAQEVHGTPLPPYKQEELFIAWIHKPSLRYVARACGVDPRTVDRYRIANDWARRVELIRSGASEQIDTMLAASIAIQLHEIAVLRKRAYLEAMKGRFDNARQALQSFIELSKLELDLRPHAEQEAGEDIIVIARRMYEQRKQRGADGATIVREIAAQVVAEKPASSGHGDSSATNKPTQAGDRKENAKDALSSEEPQDA